MRKILLNFAIYSLLFVSLYFLLRDLDIPFIVKYAITFIIVQLYTTFDILKLFGGNKNG